MGARMQIDLFERNKCEIEDGSRIARTGEGFKFNHNKNQSHEFTDALGNMLSSLFDNNTIHSIQRETVATRATWLALISSGSNNLLELPVNLKNEHFEKEWTVS